MKTRGFLLAVAFATMAFTLSCSSDDASPSNDGTQGNISSSSVGGQGGGSSSSVGGSSPSNSGSSLDYNYCVVETKGLNGELLLGSCWGQTVYGDDCLFLFGDNGRYSNNCPQGYTCLGCDVGSSSSLSGGNSSSSGNGNQFNPNIQYTSFTDSRDGKTYKSVKIGSQTWMAQNLDYHGEDGYLGSCYSDNPDYCAKYGRLYNLKTALTVCPVGWHLPSVTEWITLTDYVGTNAGIKLKATSGWNSKGNGLDDFGFSALPGGYRISNSYINIGSSGYWWCDRLYYRSMGNNSSLVDGVTTGDEYYRLSVRCVEDGSGDGSSSSVGGSSSSSSSNQFNPNIQYTSFTDSRDGKTYRSVKIDSQTWMAENLNYDVPNNAEDVCYNGNAVNCTKYGRLYNLETALTVCPVGWHLPSDTEWTTLTDYAVDVSITTGTKLKAQSGWTNSNGTDQFGFSALPGGYRPWNPDLVEGGFLSIGSYGYWWSSTGTLDAAWSRYISSTVSDVAKGVHNKSSLMSVRCVKD